MKTFIDLVGGHISDPRMWIVIITTPLIFIRVIYVSIRNRNTWGISGVVVNLAPILTFWSGGLFVFSHVMGLGSSEFADLGGFLMGAAGVLNGAILVYKARRDECETKEAISKLYQKACISFISGSIILLLFAMVAL